MNVSLSQQKLVASLAVALVGLLLASAQGDPDAAQESRDPVDRKHTFTSDSTLDDYLAYAFDHSRALKAADATASASAETAKQAGYLEDPMLTYEHMLEQHDMQYRIGITQMIPGPGKLRLKRKAASENANAVQHDSEAMRLMVFEHVVASFYEYHYLGRETTITKEHLVLLADLEKVLLARFKTKNAAYSDVLKVQVEKDNLENHLAGLKDMRAVASARLSSLLDLSPADPLPWPKVTQATESTLSDDVLMSMLAMLNPELRAIDSRIESLAAKQKLAKWNRLPDFFVGAGYHVMPEQDDGSTPEDYGLTVGISLPLWQGKYSSAAKEAAFAKKAAVNAREQLKRDLQTDLKKALFDLRDAQRQVELLNASLIPKARQAFEVARKDFVNGEAGFMTLIDAQRTLFRLSLKLERALADHEIAIGEIGCCVGKYDLKALGLDE